MTVKVIPPGYERLTVYIIVRGAAQAIDFYQRAFAAVECLRMLGPDGTTIAHAELRIGESMLMLADEAGAALGRSPHALGGTPFCFVMYVADVDAVFHRAVAAGASVLQPPENKFYGDRSGVIVDPFGHQWALMCHIEDVPPDELAKRAKG
jgi:PhnB protein